MKNGLYFYFDWVLLVKLIYLSGGLLCMEAMLYRKLLLLLLLLYDY